MDCVGAGYTREQLGLKAQRGAITERLLTRDLRLVHPRARGGKVSLWPLSGDVPTARKMRDF